MAARLIPRSNIRREPYSPGRGCRYGGYDPSGPLAEPCPAGNRHAVPRRAAGDGPQPAPAARSARRPPRAGPALAGPQLPGAQPRRAAGDRPARLAADDHQRVPGAGPGYAGCAAQVVVQRADRHLVHPHPAARRRSARSSPAGPARPGPPRRRHDLASTASPPGAGTPAYLQQAYDLTYLSATAGAGDTSRSSTPATTPTPSPIWPPTAHTTGCRPARPPTAAFARSTRAARARPCRARWPAGARRSRSISTPSRRCAPTATSCSSSPTRTRPPTSTPASPPPRRWAPTRSRPAGAPTPRRRLGTLVPRGQRAGGRRRQRLCRRRARASIPPAFPGITAVGGDHA